MAIVISGGPRVSRRFAGLKLRQFQIGSVTDADTVALGVANAEIIATRNIASAANASTSVGSSVTPFDGALANDRRHQAYFASDANAAISTVTYDTTTNGGTSVLMVWSRS